MLDTTPDMTTSGITWRSDMENAHRDGRDILAWFPLEGLGPDWCRCVPVYWSKQEQRWNFAGRAASGFSKTYEPSHWAEITPPTGA